MKLNGTFSVTAPQADVFAAIRDASFFISCVKGASDLNEIDDRNYTGKLDTRVAYIRFKFDVEVQITRIEEPNLIEAHVTGIPSGIVGRLTSSATMRLRQEGDDTIIDYDIDSTLSGRLGSIGQPVLKSKAREMEREFTERLRAAFSGESAERKAS